MNKNTLQIVVWKEGKYFVAQCLNVDVSSFGKTKKDAVKNLNEALELYFEDENKSEIAKIESPEVMEMNIAYA